MKFKLFILILLLTLLLGCSNKAGKEYDSITSNLTIVNSMESTNLSMINCMNVIDGKLFISDQNLAKFFIYDTENLTLVDSLGRQGQGPLEFKLPRSIVKYGENIIVNDTANRRIQVLDSQLNLKKTYTVPLSWIIKNYDNTIYGASAGFMAGAKIIKLNENETTTEVCNIGALFDKQKREQMERPFHFWINNKDILIAMEITGELFKVSENAEPEALINPFQKMEHAALGDFQSYKKGFLLFASYLVMDKELMSVAAFKSHLLYYESNELVKIYKVPEEIIAANSFAWTISGEFVYMFDSAETKLYKLKIEN